MISIDLHLNRLKNELTIIHQELQETLHADDNKRRDIMARVSEKVRHLRSQLDNLAITVNVK